MTKDFIEYKSGVQIEEGRVVRVATPGFFVGNVITALLITAFYPHFPKLRKSASLKMVRITLVVP